MNADDPTIEKNSFSFPIPFQINTAAGLYSDLSGFGIMVGGMFRMTYAEYGQVNILQLMVRAMPNLDVTFECFLFLKIICLQFFLSQVTMFMLLVNLFVNKKM